MPNLVLLGHEWDTCSDMLPFNMFIPVCTYIGGLIPLAITTYIPREAECFLQPGHTWYRVAIGLIFITFCVQVATELLTLLIGLFGTPLQTRKRVAAEWLLVFTYMVNLVQLGGTCFGSWVLSKYRNVPCREDKALRPLVICSWVLLGLSFLWTILCLKWRGGAQSNVEAWVKKLRFVCFICSCLGFETALEPLRKMDLAEDNDSQASQRENALIEHLAETFHVIFGDVNFTVSDRHCALVLATALQQRRRHDRIKACLLDGADPQVHIQEKGKHFSPALKRSITHKFPTIVTPSNFAWKLNPTMNAQEAADRYTGCSDRVDQDDLEEALGYFEYAVAAYYVVDQGMTATNDSQTEGGDETVTEAKGVEEASPADPGAAAERPMGDAPPPKNEDLADETAPTFQEDPGPQAPEAAHVGTQETHPPSPPAANGLSRVPEAASSQSEEQLSTPAPSQDSPRARDGKRETSFKGLRQTQEDGKGGQGTEERSGGQRKEMGDGDAAGDRETRIRIDADAGETGGEDGGGVREAVSGGLQTLRDKLSGKASEVQSKGGSIEMGSHPSGRSGMGAAVEKLEGVDATAEKAMRGDMQKGGRSMGRSNPKASAKMDGMGKKVINEDGEDKVKSKGMCRCESEVVTTTPLDALDCIYSRADNTILGTLPYMIALDWERRAIVLGVRGTSSISDALTDAIAQPIPILPWLGDVIAEPDGGIASVHSGILASAAALNHDLEDHGILNALLTGAAVDRKAKERHTAAETSSVNDALIAAFAAAQEGEPSVDLDALVKLQGASGEAQAKSPQAPRSFQPPDNSRPENHGPEPDPRRRKSVTFSLASGEASRADAALKSVSFGPQPAMGMSNGEAKPKLSTPFASVQQKQAAEIQMERMSLGMWREDGGGRGGQAAAAVAPANRTGRASSAELMATDSDVIKQCMEVQNSQKLRNEEARKARVLQRKPSGVFSLSRLSPQKASRKHPGSLNPQGGSGSPASQASPAPSGDIDAEVGGNRSPAQRRSQSSRYPRAALRPIVSGIPSLSVGNEPGVQADLGRLREPSDGATLDQGTQDLHQSLEERGVDLEAGRPSLSLPMGAGRQGDDQVGDQGAPEGRQRSGMWRGREGSLGRSGSLRVFGHRERRHSPERRDCATVSERSKSGFVPDIGRTMMRLYSDAKEAFKDNISPPGSPSRRQAAREARRRAHEERHERRHDQLMEAMKTVEEQLQKTFLAKIFKSQEDLKLLADAALQEEHKQKRAKFRAKQLQQLEERKLDCRGWQLVLTGHSLGAGVAALLALKLRPRFPDVPIKCWAYCPPGGLVTPGLSKAMQPFCTSVVVGKDGVPRASLGNLSRLVDEVVVGLARGKHCKTRVLLCNLTARGRRKLRRPGDFYSMDDIPNECQAVLDQYIAGAPKRLEAIGVPVYPPGKIMYCRRLKENATDVSYDTVWIPAELIMQEGFIMSGKMMKDHLCDSVTAALEGSIERLKGAMPKKTGSVHGSAGDSSDDGSDSE